ncbi:MAG TPA: trypsin-like peptidase domain-containing protein [Casimicrobiaceae bacterium]
MLRKFWLLFAQASTLCLAALFVVATLRPDLLPRFTQPVGNVVLLQQSGAAPTAPNDTGRNPTFAEAAKKAMPAVVNIYSSKVARSRNPVLDDSILKRYFPELAERTASRRATNLGSGVIVAPEGYILTSYHVVEGADDIEVVLSDGRQMRALVRGSDPESDLAVLKAEGDNLPAITFAAPEAVQVGDVVLAIGNPFGFGSTVTLGIVSALGRNQLGINRFEDFIQTDAAINPGNSGGALVDATGHLVGINSTIYSQTGGSMGIGFAIPVSLARTVLTQIIKDGEVTRGWLGIEPQAVTRELAEALSLARADGVLVRGVQQDGPAQRAGLLPRDVVTEIAGRPTPDVPQLLARIAELKPGSNAKIRMWREGKPIEVDVTVGRRPKPQQQPQ